MARGFRAAFQRRLAEVQAREEFTDRLVDIIPALHPADGIVFLGGIVSGITVTAVSLVLLR